MIFWEIIRRFLGYVRFKAYGGFSNEFLNEAHRMNIRLWELESRKGALYCKAYAVEYKRIRKCARASGMRLKVQKRYGLPFFAAKYSHRAGLLIGTAAFIAITLYFSSLVWVVEVKGNENLETSAVIEAFEKVGLKPGASKSSIVPDDIQHAVQEELNSLAFVSVNINGSVATVELREVTAAPETVDKSKICNVVAKTDGEIIEISALSGKKCVKVGDGVTAGQILISGIYETDKGTLIKKHAMGSVIARTTRKLVCEVPLLREERIPTGETRKIFSLRILGTSLSLPLYGFDENWSKKAEESSLVINGRKLPFAFCTESYERFEIEKADVSTEDASIEAALEMRDLLEQLKDEVKIENVRYTTFWDEKVYVYTAICTCVEEIALETEILFQ